MGIDDNRGSSSDRSIVFPNSMNAASPSAVLRTPARARIPSHYVQPNDVKALADIVAEGDVIPTPNDDQQHSHVHPLLRLSSSNLNVSHRAGTKSEIPTRYNADAGAHPLLRSPVRVSPQGAQERHSSNPLPPAERSSSTDSTSRPRFHRRSYSVPVKSSGDDERNASPSSERSHSAGTIPSRIDVQDSILEGLTAQLNKNIERHGEAHPKVAKLYNQIGNHHLRQGEHELSLEKYQNALRCFQLIAASSSRSSSPLLGNTRRDEDITTTMSIAATLGNIGTVQWRMGRLQDAIETLQKAVSTAENYSGDASQEVSNLLFTLGMAHSLNQDYEEAIECFARMKHIVTNIYGPLHVEVARAVDMIGKVCVLKGNPNQAIQFHSDALRVKQNVLGPRHPSVLQTQMNLVLAFKADKKYQDALMQLNEMRSARKIALYKEADAEMRRSLAGNIGDIARLISEIQREMNQGDENNNGMDTIDEHQVS